MTLIVPIAADSPEYDCKLPPVFSLTEAGYMRCVQSVQALDLTRFDKILFVILDKHDRRFGIADMLRLQISRLGLDNAQVLTLPEPTADQPETVAQTIAMAHLSGPVFIKDADCGFNAEWIPSANCVAVHPLERLSLVDPQHKSYVTVDDMGFVTNIIEKRVVSHFFCAGGYGFADADEFMAHYRKLRGFGQLYLSHIIYAMLLDGKTFRPVFTDNYRDYTLEHQ